MLEQILQDIEQELVEDNFGVELLVADRWLLTSALQKAIRRGEVGIALRAAASLLKMDSNYFWYRLPIIAAEDVGAASADIVSKVFTAAASPTWRRTVGDNAVGLNLVRQLCGAVKTRLADCILLQVERSKLFSDLRYKFASWEDTQLIRYIIDEDKPLPKRCLNLWILAGTNKYPSPHLFPRIGSRESVTKALSLLNIPEQLKQACISSIYRSQYPLSIFTPLIWQELQKQPCSITTSRIAPTASVNGIPHCGVDQYTRIGKAAIRELKTLTPALKPYNTSQLGIGLFYVEGHIIDRELRSLQLDAIVKQGEYADAESTGLSLPDYMLMKHHISQNMDKLALIRSELLSKYLGGLV